MTGFNHGMTGALIALSVKNSAIAVPLSVLSHFAQDMLPHWDYGVRRNSHGQKPAFFNRKFNRTLIADFIGSLVLMVVLALMFPSQKWLIWACMIAAAAPDLMWAYYRLYIEHIKKLTPKLGAVAKFHTKVQWSQTARGLYVEMLWFIVVADIIILHYWSIQS